MRECLAIAEKARGAGWRIAQKVSTLETQVAEKVSTQKEQLDEKVSTLKTQVEEHSESLEKHTQELAHHEKSINGNLKLITGLKKQCVRQTNLIQWIIQLLQEKNLIKSNAKSEESGHDE